MIERVAYVVNSFPKLSETFIAEELAELRRRGIEVRILSLRRPDEDEPHHEVVERSNLLEHTRYDRDEFERGLDAFDPDLVHAHFATRPAHAARELARAHRLRYSFTAHRYDIYDRPPRDFKALADEACVAVTVSDANVRYIRDTFGVTGAIPVVPCGVDTHRLVPGKPAEPPLGLSGGAMGSPVAVSQRRIEPFSSPEASTAPSWR